MEDDVDEASSERPAKRIKQEEKDDQLFQDEKGKVIRDFFEIASSWCSVLTKIVALGFILGDQSRSGGPRGRQNVCLLIFYAFSTQKHIRMHF